MHSDQVLSVFVTPDGKYVVTASNDKTVQTLKGHYEQVCFVCVTPDGK